MAVYKGYKKTQKTNKKIVIGKNMCIIVIMKAVQFLKSESDKGTIMKSNTIKKIDTEMSVIPTDKFSTLKDLLIENAKNFNEGLSLKANLLIQSSLITIDDKLSIHKCVVNSEKDNTISNEQLEKWIESIYINGLNKTYDNLTWNDFKKSSSDYYLHFKLLKEIAPAVQFMTGRYHNGSSKLEQLPLCKVDTIKDSLTAIVPTANSGDFMRGNEMYLRLSFLNSLDTKIKSAILTNANGFDKRLIKDIEDNIKTFENFTVNQIIDIANTIINYRFIEKKGSRDRDDNIKSSISDLQSEIQKAKKEDAHVMSNHRFTELNNLLDVIISESLQRNDYGNIKTIINKINESLSNNKDFQQYLSNEKFVFVAEQFTSNSNRYEQIMKALGNRK